MKDFSYSDLLYIRACNGYLTHAQIARNLNVPASWIEKILTKHEPPKKTYGMQFHEPEPVPDKPKVRLRRPPAEYSNESREDAINRILRTLI